MLAVRAPLTESVQSALPKESSVGNKQLLPGSLVAASTLGGLISGYRNRGTTSCRRCSTKSFRQVRR
jgi:hypothetical protein